MSRQYKKLEDKIDGIIPKEGMGATIHVDKYTVPCTVIHVGTTDRRAPMVGVQTDKTGKGEFFKDAEGTVLLFTYRKTGEWRQYGYGYRTGPVLELAVRRSKSFTVTDEGYADAVASEHAVRHTGAVEHAVSDAVPHEDTVDDAVRHAVSPAERIRARLRGEI